MKRSLAIAFVVGVAAFALSPVAYMAFTTLYVDTVVVRPESTSPSPGYRTGIVKDIRPVNPRETRIRIDEDHFVSVRLAANTERGFRPGDAVFFSPGPDVLKHEPSSPVRLYHSEPASRIVLWAPGIVTEISSQHARINAKALTDFSVPSQSLTGFDLKQGSRIHFRPEKTFSLIHYHGLSKEFSPFLRALGRWLTFRKADFPKRLGLLFNTLVVSIGTALLATVFGVGYALLTVKFQTPGRSILSWIYITPLLIPPYISAIAWTLVLGEQGSVSTLLKSVFHLEKAPFTIYGIPGSILVLSLSFFPIVALLAQAGLRSVHREQEEAALLHGGRWRTLSRITLRLAGPYIISGMVFVFIFALSSSGAPALLRLQLYSSQVMVAFQTDLSGGEAMATGTPLVLLAMAAVIFQGILHGRRRFTSEGGVPLCFPLGIPGKIAALLGCCLLLLLAAGVPLIILIERAGSLESFRTALVEMRKDIWHSIVIAAGAATLSTIVGGFIGYMAARVPRGSALEILTIIPYAAPASVIGVGLLGLWDRPGPAGAVFVSGFIIILAGFTRFIPFAVKPAAAAVRTIDPSLEEAAKVHGVSWLRRTAQVVLPLSGKGLAAAWILVFILTLSELDATILVAPAGITTAPIRIFNAIHFGRVEIVSALCLIIVFIAAAPLMVYTLLTSKKLEVF
ncbi:MAG: ABC transporter permease [Planctomycetota bacterium]|jgi:iron(III) transport system permease protein